MDKFRDNVFLLSVCIIVWAIILTFIYLFFAFLLFDWSWFILALLIRCAFGGGIVSYFGLIKNRTAAEAINYLYED